MEMKLTNTKRNYVWYHISGSLPDSSLLLDMIQMPQFLFYFFVFWASIAPKTEFMLLDSAGFICANGQLSLWF